MTDEALGRMLTVFKAEYGVDFNSAQKQWWATMLGPLSDAEADEATIGWVREESRAPKPGDIWRRCRGVKLPTREETEHLSREAELALAFVRQYVDDMACNFGGVINATIRAFGGLQAVIDMFIDDQVQYQRPRWNTLWTAIRLRGVQPDSDEGRFVATNRYFEAKNQERRRGTGGDMVPAVAQHVFSGYLPALRYLPAPPNGHSGPPTAPQNDSTDRPRLTG